MNIQMAEQDSRIVSTSERLEILVEFLKDQDFSSILIIADHRIFALHGEPLLKLLDTIKANSVEPMIIPSGEQYKSLAMAENCWTHMHAMGLDRKSLVIALGGGVVTDLGGFVASTYMRGVANVAIPTTLMGMVDAAIGGKTAVNLPTGKNIVGAFYHPKLIAIAPHYLNSLPDREFRSGLAEVIKYGVILDPELFAYLEKHLPAILNKNLKSLESIIYKSCALKADVVQKDEKEQGLRAILNWGHTFAHAIETATNYDTYLHGEAVSIGMCCAASASLEKGLVDKEFVKKQVSICQQAGLPTKISKDLDIDHLIDLMKADKKSLSGQINLILAKKIGQVELVKNVDRDTIKKAFLARL